VNARVPLAASGSTSDGLLMEAPIRWTASADAMTRQPTPSITRADVERIVRRDFPADRSAEVLALLDDYGTEAWQRAPDRVRLAALKLAAGSFERLRSQIEQAKCDYRDVLGAAEYPGYMKLLFRIQDLPPDERQRVIDADWSQYQDWLTRR